MGPCREYGKGIINATIRNYRGLVEFFEVITKEVLYL